MKVLIVADRFFPIDPGGLARVAWDVAKALARRGHSVDLVAAESSVDQSAGETQAVDGVTVHLFGRPTFPAWHPHRMSVPIALFTESIRRLLAAKAFDIVHYHSIFTGAAVERATRHLAASPGLAYTVHSPVAQEQVLTWSRQGVVGLVNQAIGLPIVRRMERSLLGRAQATHVLSRFTADELAKEHPRLSLRCTLIPHFAYPDWGRQMSRTEARERLGWPTAGKKLFTVRQLRYRYGIDDAIRAVAPLAAAGRCTLYIGGDGPDRTQLQSLIDRVGCHDSIRLLGRLSDEHLRLAYQAADLFLLPTRALECFGLISLEAMVHGLPVLGTTVGAIPEVIAPIMPEFLAPPSDPPSYGAKIEAFLDGRLAPLPEDRILAYVQQSYSEAVVMGKYERMYEQIVGGRPHR